MVKPQSQSEPLIRNVSDTARWVAAYRAQETERPDAIFRDPFARRLAGERGEKIAKLMPLGRDNSWSMITRTYLIDEFIKAELQRGADLVVNLAAGLDSRPYRMQLPPKLRWVEVDLPEILDYKESVLRDEHPVCALERIRLDLSSLSARRELFARLGQSAKRALIITEGLMIYLTPEAVGELAADLAAPASFHSWLVDIASPGLLRMLRKRMASQLREAAPFRFAPEEGPAFFTPRGWKPVEVQSLLKNAARLNACHSFYDWSHCFRRMRNRGAIGHGQAFASSPTRKACNHLTPIVLSQNWPHVQMTRSRTRRSLSRNRYPALR